MSETKKQVQKVAWKLLSAKISNEGMNGKFTLGELVDVIRLCEDEGKVLNLHLSPEQVKASREYMAQVSGGGA